MKELSDRKIGIVGVGMVGGALRHYFELANITPFLYDPSRKLGSQREINQADIVFVCVPTPFVKGQGFDLSYVENTLQWLEDEKIVVIKSTVLPGTTEKLQEKYAQHRFLFNPEFLVEERALEDMIHPERQIVGYTKQSQGDAEEILRMLPEAPFKKILPVTEAEIVKYFGNTYLAVKVIFANQMYELCQKLGVDYDLVRESASEDKRIGPSHLDVFHGGYRGYGGKCLTKDIRALIEIAENHEVDLKLHKLVEDVNNELMDMQGIEDPESFSKRD